MALKRRKIVGTKVIEIYEYTTDNSRKDFFDHHHLMRQRGFKSDRVNDKQFEDHFLVTYEKDVKAQEIKKETFKRRY